MDFDLNAWLDDIGIAGDDRALATKLFSDETRVTKLKGSVLRQADFSKKMDGLTTREKAIQKELDDAKAEVESERGALVTWRTNAEGKLTDSQKKADELERKLFDVRQRATKLAEDNGIDVKEFGFDAAPVGDEKKPEPKTYDDTTLRKEVGSSLVGLAKLPAMLMKMNARHRTLFGTDIPDPEKLVELVLESTAKGKQVTLEDTWKEQYKVDAKQAEVDQASFDKRVDDAVEEKMRTRLENEELGAKNPGDLPGSPILQKFGKKPADQNQDERKRHNGETGADAAKKAFRSGKFREEARAISRAALAG